MMDEDGSLRPEGWSSVGCEDRVGGGRGGRALGKVARTNIFIHSLQDHLHSKPIIVHLSQNGFVGVCGVKSPATCCSS